MTENGPENSVLPIPQVPTHWFRGNLPDLDPAFFAKSYWQLAELYGPIFQLDLGGLKAVIVSNYELLKDVQDDDKFEKFLSTQIIELRDLIGDGLFTARNDEPNWAKAHRILMPVFGPMGVKKMFDQQMDIASQMILKWDRYGPENEIMCSDDFTRLAFDTIGLCAFNYRFNEFYADHIHPFAQQMADSLIHAGKRGIRTRLENALYVQEDRKYRHDIAAQHKLCEDIIQERIKNPRPEINDLLNVMLHTKDPVTGETLDSENIRNQMATFLIAGHETTSGTLSFLFYHFGRYPETYHKAQQEVDEVVSTGSLTLAHISKLKYVEACVKETLRCHGPITMNGRHLKKTTIIGGKGGRYQVHPEQLVQLNLYGVHHDRAVWGEDADEFKPERMLDFEKIPEGAWKPFGTGMRACIGRAFAEQEIMINVALILQRFQVEMVDPGYKLEYLVTMTVKPKDLKIRVRRRPGRSVDVGLSKGHTDIQQHENKSELVQDNGKSLLIVYGSNAGTCQAYAEQLAADSTQRGYYVETKTMDAVVEHLPVDRPVAIITPSYEGKPADNAKKFVAWLEANKHAQVLKGVKYFVLGVGNPEWAQTYLKVPKRVDYLMGTMGAQRILDACFVNIEGDTIGPFEEWRDRIWNAFGAQIEAPQRTLKATISKSHTAKTLAGFNQTTGVVRKNIQIADASVGAQKKHMEIELPENMTYSSGDYIAILPFNHRDNVRRVLTRFGLLSDDAIRVTETSKAFLESEGPISVFDLLASRVELATPVTQKQLRQLAELTGEPQERDDIVKMADDRWTETLNRRYSIIDVLEDHPSCKMEFLDYLDLLKPMTARQYSISSSMIDHAVDAVNASATVTYDVHETAAWSGHGRIFHGATSSYLADLKPGSKVRCTVRPTNAGFHLPKDPQTPIIMVCSGTGLSPMRGFIEERAAIKKARGTELGPALLYFGCRDVDKDFIYKGQLEEWEKEGVVSLRPCFSKHGTEKDHYKYTSDRIYADREECGKLFRQGAKVFLCGSASKIAKSTAETFIRIYEEMFPSTTREDAEKWLDGIKEDRYVSDVFG